jgi:hypothetical protein
VQSQEDASAALQRLPLFGLGMQEAVCVIPLAPYRGFAAG